MASILVPLLGFDWCLGTLDFKEYNAKKVLLGSRINLDKLP